MTSSSKPTYSYEFFTIQTDSISSNTWTVAGIQSSFTTYMFRPLKDIVQASILSCSLSATGSNVVYLSIPQLSSLYNENTGFPAPQSNTAAIVSVPSTKDKIRTSFARFNVPATGRIIYNQNDFSTQTQFTAPIRKLDRITCELFDEAGNVATITSNTFISFRFTCMRDNISPKEKSSK